MSNTYVESFDDGPGGWHLWVDNFRGATRLEMKDGAMVSRAPW